MVLVDDPSVKGDHDDDLIAQAADRSPHQVQPQTPPVRSSHEKINVHRRIRHVRRAEHPEDAVPCGEPREGFVRGPVHRSNIEHGPPALRISRKILETMYLKCSLVSFTGSNWRRKENVSDSEIRRT